LDLNKIISGQNGEEKSEDKPEGGPGPFFFIILTIFVIAAALLGYRAYKRR